MSGWECIIRSFDMCHCVVEDQDMIIIRVVVMFLGLRRVHFSFSTCLLSFSHHVTNHPSTSITWPTTWPVTCHPSHLIFKVTCPASPVPKSPAHHLILPHLTSCDLILTPDLFLFAYLKASLLESRPAGYTFFIALFCDSYWLPSCFLHAWVSSTRYDSISCTMTPY